MIWQVDQAIRLIAQTGLRRQNVPEARDFSVCGLFCGQRQMAKFNMPEIVVNCKRKDHFSKEKRSFCGAATQIRTGDLILTKRPRNFVLTIFSALWPYPLQTIFFSSLFERKVSTHSAAVCGRLCGQTIEAEDFCDLTVCTKVVRTQFSAPPK